MTHNTCKLTFSISNIQLTPYNTTKKEHKRNTSLRHKLKSVSDRIMLKHVSIFQYSKERGRPSSYTTTLDSHSL